MESIKTDDYRKSIIYLFKETFEGSPPQGSIYLDKGVGVFNSIGEINAVDASKSIAGANIAAHTEHIRYYFEVLNNFVNGTVQVADWSKSWNIKEVSEDEWKIIQVKLRKDYESVVETFETFDNWNQDTITEANAMIVHSAYHLGAIRQIVKGL